MTNLQKSEIVTKVKEKMATLSISANKAAQLLGINAGSLSLILNEKWLENESLVSEERWVILANWTDYFQTWQVAETPDFKRILNICKHAQKNSLSRAISFDPGTGKSFSLQYYANNNTNVFYLEAEEYFTKKVFLQKLAQAMGLEIISSIAELVEAITGHLNKIKNPLVIIDEADKLKDGILSFYKTLYNKTRCGFVLAGTPHFRLRILKGVRLQKMSYQEIYSRLGGEFLSLYGISEPISDREPNNTVQLICLANGISEPSEIQEVMENANGDLRRVKAIIEDLHLRHIKYKAA